MKNRILYLDSLRGLAMLFVVMGHVCLFSFNMSDPSLIQPFISVEIPLFFLVSGYFAFRGEEDYWTIPKIGKTIWNRFLLLVVPAIFFLALFEVTILHDTLGNGLFANYKHGYWFTLTLFGFNLIYFAYILLLKVVKISNWLKTTILLSGGGSSAFCCRIF